VEHGVLPATVAQRRSTTPPRRADKTRPDSGMRATPRLRMVSTSASADAGCFEKLTEIRPGSVALAWAPRRPSAVHQTDALETGAHTGSALPLTPRSPAPPGTAPSRSSCGRKPLEPYPAGTSR